MAEESGGALRELFALFQVQVDPEDNLKKGHAKVSSFIDKLKEGAKIVAEVFAIDKIKEFVEGQVEAALALERTSIQLGISTEKVEQYQMAAAGAGVHTEDLNMALLHLNRTLGSSKGGGKGRGADAGEGGGAALDKLLGAKQAHEAQKSGTVMEEVAEAISKIPKAADRAKVAYELFGRQGARLLPLLAKGREGFEEARKEMDELGGPTSKEFIENAKKVEESQVRLTFVWQRVSQALAAGFLPKVVKLIEIFVKASKVIIDFEKHTKILTTGLMVLSAVAVAKLITQLGALAEEMGIVGLRSLVAFAVPILIAGALYLAFDEVFTLLTGGETIIGDAANAFLGFGAAQDLAQDLQDVWQVFLNLMKAVGDAAGDTATIIVEGFKLAWAELNKVEDALEGLLSKIPGASYVLGFKQGGRTEAEKAATDQDAERAKTEAGHAFSDIGKIFGRDLGAGTTIGKPSIRNFYAEGNQGPAPVAVPYAGGAQLPSLTVNQDMHFKNEPGDPLAVKRAAKSGVADAHQRQQYAAGTAQNKP
jgi:hypothetical protein